MKKIILSFLFAAVLSSGSLLFAKDDAPVPAVSIQSLNQYATEPLKKFTIDLPADNIVIHKSADSESTKIIITVESNYVDATPQVIPSKKGDSILIQQKQKTNKLNGRISNIDVSVPEGYSIPELVISANSKDISLSEITAQKMNLSTSVGKIDLQSVTAAELEISVASGKLSAKKVNATKFLSVKDTNAEINIDGIDTPDLSLDVQKGKAVLAGISVTKINLNADKGSISATLKNLPTSDINLKTGSGKLTLYVPARSNIWTTGTVDKKGHFKSSFTEDSAGSKIDFKIGSGELLIEAVQPAPAGSLQISVVENTTEDSEVTVVEN